MGLLDSLFGGAGGPDANEQTDGLMAQLGLDPAAIRKQAGLQGLSQMGAAILANSGPSTVPHGFAQALGQGLQAGQQGYGDATTAQIARMAQLMQLQKMQLGLKDTTEERARRDAAPGKLQALLDDPENGLDPQVKKLATTLLATGETDKAGQIIATFMGREKAPKTPQIITRADGSIVAVDPNSLAATQIMGGVAKPHEPRAPNELETAIQLAKIYGIDPKSVLASKFNIDPTTGAPKTKPSPTDAADAKGRMKAMAELNDAIPSVEEQIRASDEMMSKLKPGPNGEPAEYDFGNGLSRMGANLLPQSLKPDKVVDAQKNYNRLVLGDIPALKTRVTNFEFGQLQKMNPSVEVSAAENMRILQARREKLNAIHQRLLKEAQHYGNGGTVQDWTKNGGGLDFQAANNAIDEGQQAPTAPDLLSAYQALQDGQ